MSDNGDKQTLDSFDKASLIGDLDGAFPQIIEELSDLAERRTPRVTKKDRQEALEEMSSGLDASMPYLKALEGLKKDGSQAKEASRIIEELLRKLFRLKGIRLRSQEHPLHYLLRKQFEVLKVPAAVRRLKQYRIVRQGLENLMVAVINSPRGENAARQLIEDYHQKHGKEYMRYLNSLKTRSAQYQNVKPRRVTHAVITRLTNEYRDTSAAFEKRLRLLVGLYFIVQGKPETWENLRRRGYNELLQVVGSPNNPSLHFLKDVIDRNVRNVVMHGEPSYSPTKGIVKFVDYSPSKGDKEITWTISKFISKTKNLTLTMLTVMQLEMLFIYVRSYRVYLYVVGTT